MSTQEHYDLAVIGGGVNGTGIARDAQGRLKTLLIEAKDFASAPSASTKLIHGGLRYLETYEFKMVGEALAEREVIMRAAPHIVWPLRFCLPHSPEQRPFLMIRAGLFLYDSLGKRELRPARAGCRCGPARKAPRCRTGSGAVSSIPIAGCRTRGWSCSTPWTPRPGAPPCAPAPPSPRPAAATTAATGP